MVRRGLSHEVGDLEKKSATMRDLLAEVFKKGEVDRLLILAEGLGCDSLRSVFPSHHACPGGIDADK